MWLGRGGTGQQELGGVLLLCDEKWLAAHAQYEPTWDLCPMHSPSESQAGVGFASREAWAVPTVAGASWGECRELQALAQGSLSWVCPVGGVKDPSPPPLLGTQRLVEKNPEERC